MYLFMYHFLPLSEMWHYLIISPTNFFWVVPTLTEQEWKTGFKGILHLLQKQSTAEREMKKLNTIIYTTGLPLRWRLKF